jgi:Chaperone of endosialidase
MSIPRNLGAFADNVASDGSINSALGAVIQGLTVGKGAGSVSNNTVVGNGALASTTGSSSGNAAFGASALAALTSGTNNTAMGWNAMALGTTAASNTAIGENTLFYNNGSNNTAVGYQTLQGSGGNTFSYNTAIGALALYNNTTASYNTAVGFEVGRSNTTGSYNTWVGGIEYNGGLATGRNNTTGQYNAALGNGALAQNTTASNNTAVGYQAGYSNTTGAGNTVVGYQAGYALTTGSYNTFIGVNNLVNGSAGSAITTGSYNTIIGAYTGNQGGLDFRTANYNIVLSDGVGNPRMYFNYSALTWYFSNIASGAGTNALKWNTTTGAITYDTSSARYKDNIRDSVYGLSHVMQMRSAQFEYKDTGRSDVGLIAEELQPIVPELVGVNKDGQADSVSYDRMVSVLVKAIQELKAEFDAYKEAHP